MKMGDVTEKRLSKLSRGIGTLSGNVHRETPVYHHHESSDEYSLHHDDSGKRLEDLLLFQIKGRNIIGQNSKERREGRDKVAENVVHKTYSTKLGTLVLFADSLYLKEKKAKKFVKKKIKSAFDDLNFEGTVEDLAAFILRFGDENFQFVANEKGLRDERLISVRPGYSPVRYIASVSKLWEPEKVQKLVEENALKEDHIQRYQKIKLPKIDIVPSSEYDPLLRNRPKPYSHVSLPELLMRRDGAPGMLGNVHEGKGKIEDASSGYAKSLPSVKKPVKRKELMRKKTMQMNRLELQLPSEEPKRKSSRTDEILNEEDVYDSETNDSLSDWGRLVETTRNVVNRTFENVLREKAKEEFEQSNGNKQDEDKVGNWNDLEKSHSSSANSDDIAVAGADYASLGQKQKEEVISHLLLQGIINEASTIESLMTEDNDEKASIYSENKIDLSEQVSFPSIRCPRTLSGSGKAKGFKGSALHGSLPSANSNKSKQSSKSGSLKDSLFISSALKLPPIKSEPATPNVNASNRDNFDGAGVKLPPIPKKGITNSYTGKKANFDSEAKNDNLFIGGHAIEVEDVHIHWKETTAKEAEESSDDDYDDHGDDDNLLEILRNRGNGSEESLTRDEEENFESPQSIRSQENNTHLHSPDSGLSTATGLTLASDANVAQSDHRVPKGQMTPVVEESSRSSKASKILSREGTFNRTSSSVKTGAASLAPGSPKRREETQTSLRIKEETLIEEKNEGTLSSMSKRCESAAGNRETTTDSISQHGEIDGISSEKENSLTVIQDDPNTVPVTSENVVDDTNGPSPNIAEDEGIFMEEEKQPIIQKEVTDTGKSEHAYEDSKTSTPSGSADISVKQGGDSDDAKTESNSVVSNRSSGLLIAQARAAAQSALSRPGSGYDLIEDMKFAADEFGKLFGEEILKETSKAGLVPRGRAKSDAAQVIRGKNVQDKNRSTSSLSRNAAKRAGSVDINSLKTAITSYGPAHGVKGNDGDADQKSSPPHEILEKEPTTSLEATQASDRPFAAASSQSVPSLRSSLSKDIKMDIISYDVMGANDKEKEALVVKEADSPELVRENTVDTEEERFAKALNAIVEEVKDLKEKKPPPKKKKVRKVGHKGEEKNHIVRDETPVSPPFLTGKAKDEKVPKGLSNNEQDENKAKGKKVKVKKEIVKKVKTKKEKQPKKTVTFEKVGNDSAKDKEEAIEKLKSEIAKGAKEEVQKEEVQKVEAAEEQHESFDKYDVPITIKPAASKSESGNEEEINSLPAEQGIVDEREQGGFKREVKSLQDQSPEDLSKGISFVSSAGFETDEYAGVSSNDNEENSDHRRRMDDRMQKRKMEAERRRLKVEQRRREKEEAKRKQQEQAEREERMRQEAELEMQKRIEEVKNRKRMEEEAKRRQEESERRKQKMLEREREREKREKEELKRKMAAMAEKLRLEEEGRREQERIAREMEEEQKRQEEEMLKEMEEHERIEYERKKKEEEEERLRQEEERRRLEMERRLIEEEEHRIKMQKLQEFHQMLLERAKFWEGMKNSKWFLEINQRLTQAFTFSYFDLLPAILFEFTTLRPFTPKETRFGLPTIREEKKEDEI